MDTRSQHNLWLSSMLLAPLFLVAGQFYWINGVLNATAGWLQVLSFLFWIFAFQAMFSSLKERFPIYSVWGFFIAVYACLGGNNFGLEGLFNETLNITNISMANDLGAITGLPGVIAFYLPGILFPLSLLVLSMQLWRAKKIPLALALLLGVSAIGFPASRMPRIEWLAHVDNAFLLLSMILISRYFMKSWR